MFTFEPNGRLKFFLAICILAWLLVMLFFIIFVTGVHKHCGGVVAAVLVSNNILEVDICHICQLAMHANYKGLQFFCSVCIYIILTNLHLSHTYVYICLSLDGVYSITDRQIKILLLFMYLLFNFCSLFIYYNSCLSHNPTSCDLYDTVYKDLLLLLLLIGKMTAATRARFNESLTPGRYVYK